MIKKLRDVIAVVMPESMAISAKAIAVPDKYSNKNNGLGFCLGEKQEVNVALTLHQSCSVSRRWLWVLAYLVGF